MHMLKFIPPNAKTIVELGCGDGSFAEKIKEINPSCKYFGIENETRLAKEASQKLDYIFIDKIMQVDLAKLGIDKGEIDCLIYRRTEFWCDDLLAAITKHLPFLREGGQIIVDYPHDLYIRNVFAWVSESNMAKCKVQPLKEIKAGVEKITGIQLVDVIPYSLKEDEKLKSDNELLSAIHTLFGRAGCEEKVERIWAKGYILNFNKNSSKPKDILLHTMMGEVKVCARVRIVEPHSFCATIPGVNVVNETFSANLSIGEKFQDKIFIRQRIWSELPRAADELKNLVQRGYVVISEMDDDPEFFDTHKQDNFFAFRGCHAVQTSTPELASYLRQYNPNVAVFENQLRLLPAMPLNNNSGEITLFFGALNREADWQEWMPQLNEVLSAYKHRVRVKVIYDRKFFEAVAVEHKEFIPFCPYEVYTKALADSDIAFLPLGDTHFNRMKSDLKFIECAAYGTAVLASPVVYERTIKQAVTGFIYHNAAEFKHFLALLIEKNDLRRQIAVNAYDYVRNNRLLAYHYEARYRWYESLLENLPELNQDLVRRNKELQ